MILIYFKFDFGIKKSINYDTLIFKRYFMCKSLSLISGNTKITIDSGYNSGINERVFGGEIREISKKANSIVETGGSYAVNEYGGASRLCGYNPKIVFIYGPEGKENLVKEIGKDLVMKSLI